VKKRNDFGFSILDFRLSERNHRGVSAVRSVSLAPNPKSKI
jgi:hypothetical protein